MKHQKGKPQKIRLLIGPNHRLEAIGEASADGLEYLQWYARAFFSYMPWEIKDAQGNTLARALPEFTGCQAIISHTQQKAAI